MVAMHGVGVDQLREAVGVLSEWQRDGAAVQLYPGDLGWQWRFGAAATAAALRTWSRDGQTLAIGMLDAPGLLRLAIAPENHDDEELARQMVSDVSKPGRDVLPRGEASVEARFGGPFRALLVDEGWIAGEPWTPLQRDLAEPVKECGMRVEVIGPERAGVRVAVQRATFDGSTFTAARWLAMASGSPYADARCLVAYDENETAVAAATVWSAVRADRGCSNRSVCTGTIAVVVMAQRSRSPRQLPCGKWGYRARACAPGARMSPPWPPTGQPASTSFPRFQTYPEHRRKR